MSRAIYRGFSTANWIRNKSFSLTDIDLVKQDLLNHIFTLKGERVMMPNFGTRIPSLAFEPNDARTIAIIEEDLTEVFNYDPRVRLISLNTASLPNNNAIIAIANLLFVEFQVNEPLNIEIPVQ